MTLESKLKELQGINIKVGSFQSFVYCGICNENIFDVINKLSKEELKSLKKKVSRDKKHLKNFEEIWNRKIENAFKKVAKLKKELGKRFTKRQKEKLLAKLEKAKIKDKENTSKRLIKLKKRVETFTSFLSRKVLDVYDSIVEDNTKIVIFKGLENGQYWDAQEYQEGVAKEDK